MVESLLTWKRIKAKHLQAPLLKEREQYLTHLLNEGVSRDRVRSVATLLLHVIRLMVQAIFPDEIDVQAPIIQGAFDDRLSWAELDGMRQIRGVGLECLQLLRRLLERSGAAQKPGKSRILLKDMVGTRRLELLTSTVSKITDNPS
jgi:hypothetical protein